ncbi:MAG TPA: PDZ domain-containing protein [Woeseiaceae bacterium]|jgi:C-terminal processing protease CtpA/Prc|nr:PDZ domain-containing protein [Woeseiaceae bacterium]
MTRRNDSLAAVLALTAAMAVSPVVAQESATELEREARAAEMRAGREGGRVETIDLQLREAEKRLAEAAARVAELSRRRLPDMPNFVRHLHAGDRPVLGVTIGAGEDNGPVEGVVIRGVTPGSAAEEAGLRAGDVLTGVNDESLGADTPAEANEKLLDFMRGIEPGDQLEVEYLRDGKSDTVELEPRPAPSFAFGWQGPVAPPAPPAPPAPWARWAFYTTTGWGDMELVALTEELGRYFGTDKGLLVVRAPGDPSLKLRDGDVIQSIDGREPTSVSHALRILGSYQSGETLEIEIMRDKKRETVSVEMPDGRQGFIRRRDGPPAPAVAPVAAPPVRILLRRGRTI